MVETNNKLFGMEFDSFRIHCNWSENVCFHCQCDERLSFARFTLSFHIMNDITTAIIWPAEQKTHNLVCKKNGVISWSKSSFKCEGRKIYRIEQNQSMNSLVIDVLLKCNHNDTGVLWSRKSFVIISYRTFNVSGDKPGGKLPTYHSRIDKSRSLHSWISIKIFHFQWDSLSAITFMAWSTSIPYYCSSKSETTGY